MCVHLSRHHSWSLLHIFDRREVAHPLGEQAIGTAATRGALATGERNATIDPLNWGVRKEKAVVGGASTHFGPGQFMSWVASQSPNELHRPYAVFEVGHGPQLILRHTIRPSYCLFVLASRQY